MAVTDRAPEDTTVGDGVDPEPVDVLIVGAGLSGIDAAYRVGTECPGRSYALLEARDASGGTWDLFRYPGVRSDSDMLTLGYPFRPWRGPESIAEGPDILAYIRETAAAFGIDRRIRFGQRVTSAAWDSGAARWTVESEDPAGRRQRHSCRFLYLCTGYYSYEGGYRPELPGADRFGGTVVHPQDWPDDLDYAGKQVVVIGSGATAITLVPAMARTAAHVTMVQRSPTYVVALPRTDPLVSRLRAVLPESLAHRLARWRNVLVGQAFYLFCRYRPRAARKFLGAAAARALPEGYEMDPDFAPRYDPWDQRMCLVPDGDLFASIRDGTSSIVTGHIETFTETGVRLRSGDELEADVVVSATGLQLLAWGGIRMAVDGVPVDPGQTLVYRGCLVSDVPNFAFCAGYVNASWTLRADLSSRYVCRLLNYLAAKGYTTAVPRRRHGGVEPTPFFGLESGYVKRAAHLLPKQGDREPWRFHNNYPVDFVRSRTGRLAADMEFSGPTTPAHARHAGHAGSDPTPGGGELIGHQPRRSTGQVSTTSSPSTRCIRWW